MRQISVTTLRGNTRGKIFDVVIAMAGNRAVVLMNFRGIINFISENICLPNESRHWLFFHGRMLFPEKCQQKFRG